MQRLGAPRARFWVFATLVIGAFLMGGSARPDIQSLAFLRPFAIALGAYALIVIDRETVRPFAVPLTLLALLAMVMIGQLIPLPHSLWSGLPERGIVDQIGTTMGMTDLARPLSLAPERTVNALMSLSVPAAALLLYAVQDRAFRKRALSLFLMVAIGSALLGMLQISGGSGSAFYTYRVVNDGSPVGLFANRNHQGVFLACMVLLSTWYMTAVDRKDVRAPIRLAFGAGTFLLTFVLVLVTGSRAGLLALGLTGIASAWLLSHSGLIPRQFRIARWRIDRKYVLAGLATALALVVVAAVIQARSLSIDRLVDSIGSEDTADLRAQLVPILWHMTKSFLPFGSGFGSFEYSYHLFEPVSLLSPRYLNQAHNDWAQFAIEGGLPALLVLAGFIGWLGVRLRGIWRAPDGPLRDRGLAAGFIVLVIGLASAVDYPLRTPAMMAFFAILVAVIADCGFRLAQSGQR
ncbi:O-antigen ligase family protein [Tsuneonella mangrovi]|uniref:O-antigen ligase family protein n=1 Tax=Tsuneonella mangrovi TaxID=1982042 RepID=UPI0014709E4F|nr:O-antigen ligase family protein [Tsuneonella mangrovi]